MMTIIRGMILKICETLSCDIYIYIYIYIYIFIYINIEYRYIDTYTYMYIIVYRRLNQLTEEI